MESSFEIRLASLTGSMGYIFTITGFFRSNTLSKTLMYSLSFIAFPKLPPLCAWRWVTLSQQGSHLLCCTLQNKRYDPKDVEHKMWPWKTQRLTGPRHSHQEQVTEMQLPVFPFFHGSNPCAETPCWFCNKDMHTNIYLKSMEYLHNMSQQVWCIHFKIPSLGKCIAMKSNCIERGQAVWFRFCIIYQITWITHFSSVNWDPLLLQGLTAHEISDL